MIADARASRVLAWRLLVRDISAQYRQTAIGLLWTVVPTAAIALTWVLLSGSKIVRIPVSGIPYIVFVLTGLVFWQGFSDALTAPLSQLTNNRSILSKVRLPTEALLISGLGQAVFTLLVRIAVLVIIIAIYRPTVHWTAVFAVIPVTTLVLLGTVLGAFLAPIGFLYRDVERGLPVILTPLMLLTPVVYPNPGGILGKIMDANPLSPIFLVLRELIYGGLVHHDIVSFTAVFGATIVLALLAWIVFRLAFPLLVERLDA